MLSALLPEFVVLPQLNLSESVIACNKVQLSNFTMRMLRSGEIDLSGLVTGCSKSQPAVLVSDGKTT